jgi:hypothetical protein
MQETLHSVEGFLTLYEASTTYSVSPGSAPFLLRHSKKNSSPAAIAAPINPPIRDQDTDGPGAGVGVGVGVSVGVSVTPGVGVTSGVAVGVGVTSGVTVGVGVTTDGTGVGVGVGVDVGGMYPPPPAGYTGISAMMAVTVLSAFIVTVVESEVRSATSPFQKTNCHPSAAMALILTTVPCSYVWLPTAGSVVPLPLTATAIVSV